MNKLISEIKIGERHRKDMGDLEDLADSIRDYGLLQPIGIAEDGELVFGERRLKACRDILKWKEIDVRIVDVPTIAAGEFAENEIRKNFTPSERIAIMDTIRRYSRGGDRKSDQMPDLADVATAAKHSGFPSRQTADSARKVVNKGIPEVREAMDKGEMAIDTAALVANQSEKKQKAIMSLPEKDREEAVNTLRIQKNAGKQAKTKKYKTVTIAWHAGRAATTLVNRWPRELVAALVGELQKRLAADDGGAVCEPKGSPSSDRESARADPIKELFDRGVSLLIGCGAKEPQARSIIGKWRKTYSDPLVMAAIVHCEDESISEPVPHITRFLEHHRGANGHAKQSPADKLFEGAYRAAEAFTARQLANQPDDSEADGPLLDC